MKVNLTAERERELDARTEDLYFDLNGDAPQVAHEVYEVTPTLAERYNLETTDYVVVGVDSELNLFYLVVDKDLEPKQVNETWLHFVEGFVNGGDGLLAAADRLNNLDVDTVHLG